MTDTLSIGWSQAAAAKALKSFRRLYGFNLALQSLIALVALIWPSLLLAVVGLPDPEIAAQWVRVWAMMVIMASVLQVPGYLDPMFNRIPCVVGIVFRGLITVLYILLGGGFLWLALFDGLFAIALYVTYRRAVIAELQTRP